MKMWKRAFCFPSIFKIPGRGGIGLWVWLTGSLLFPGCGSIPEPGESHMLYAQRHGYRTSLPGLQEGRVLYIQKCDGCHMLKSPARYAPEEWPRWMDAMRKEMELPLREYDLIRTYLRIASGERRDSLSSHFQDSTTSRR